MNYQNACEQVRHPTIDTRHHFRQEMKSNFRSAPGQMVAGHQIGHFKVKLESPRDPLQGADWIGFVDVKDKQCDGPSPEIEAGGWLGDEPVDFAASVGILRSSATTGDVRGSGTLEGSMKIGDSTDDAATQPSRPRTSSSDAYAELRAKLRHTKIRKSVIKDAIERQGGGQKGLQTVIKMILFWVREANRCTSQSSGADSNLTKVIDELVLNNAGPGNVVDAQLQVAGSRCTSENVNPLLQQYTNGVIGSMPTFTDGSGSVCDLKPVGSISGENVEVREFESQSCALTAESGKSDGLLDQMDMQGLVSQELLPLPLDALAMPSDCWVPSQLASGSLHSAFTSKLPNSPDRNGLLTSPNISCDETSSRQNKIQRLLPPFAGSSSPRTSNELRAYGSSGTPPGPDVLSAPGILVSVGANPSGTDGPFSSSPSSLQVMDPHSLDSVSFNSFRPQGPILVEGNLGLGPGERGSSDSRGRLGSKYPVSPDSSLDPESLPAPALGMLAKAKASPASSRLARKKRMDRNRKVALASHHAAQAAALAGQVGAVRWGSSSSACPFTSSHSLHSMVQSRACPSSEGLVRAKDRREHKHLQYLLQKVLRPSDVGNLGRIVLPKKDAESHLPWLGAREGVQFECEDYDTGEKIMFRYRYWPNNKSRMYLLENTGDFVKKHHLQESDRLLVYRNQQRGTYIIRGRKARDCADEVSSQVQVEDKEGEGNEGEGNELSHQSSMMASCSSGSSSNEKDVETSEEVVASCLETASGALTTTVTPIATPQDDLLDFTDLPDAPMGAGAEALVRFPSLEAFDVEMLGLVPISPEKRVAGSS